MLLPGAQHHREHGEADDHRTAPVEKLRQFASDAVVADDEIEGEAQDQDDKQFLTDFHNIGWDLFFPK